MKVNSALLLISLSCGTAAAFLPSTTVVAGAPSPSFSSLCMVGGKGWDNADYLGGLGGDDDDRRKSQEDYQDFSKRRAAFNERQQELMKNPKAREFYQQQQQGMMGNRDDSGDEEDRSMFGDEFADVQPGSGGGSRMAQMMAQAKRMQQPKQPGGMLGIEQKFAPLDEIDEEEETI